jgi:2-polyprenyl-3-methyl-5-hydroxy-6-metoxy-1,4-benzoquinol methylase/GNAT superfamily N-acetyltransferase
MSLKPRENARMNIEYSSQISALERSRVLKECCELYSAHYGKWRAGSRKEGKPIRLSQNRMEQWFPNEQTKLYTARDNGTLVGYAIALRDNLPGHGLVSWVTQLVVHTDYRNKGIASHLLRHIWGLSDDYAWGIVTSNPFAIRALEKATRRRCEPDSIKNNKNKMGKSRADRLLCFGGGRIGNYISDDIERQIDSTTSRINTKFPVDHSEIENRIAALRKTGVEWMMGRLPEDWEWFAFTFRSQKPFDLNREEIEQILQNMGASVKQAYRRMLGGNGIGATDEGKPYTRHTPYEIDRIMGYCGLKNGSLVFDFGCGNGRHSNGLGGRGVNVTGIDYIKENIDLCRKNTTICSTEPEFLEGDCREISLGREADAIICLYDVIGSFLDEKDNLKILNNIARHLKPGGVAVISVMNGGITKGKVGEFSFSENPNKVLELSSSSAMEKTGEVFNPGLMLYDKSTGTYYRKEQFMKGIELPMELLVCDRRYSKKSISDLCALAGLSVDFVRHVHAGDWETDLPENDSHAKEILVKCTKTRP